jgi:hypothetical protein
MLCGGCAVTVPLASGKHWTDTACWCFVWCAASACRRQEQHGGSVQLHCGAKHAPAAHCRRELLAAAKGAGVRCPKAGAGLLEPKCLVTQGGAPWTAALQPARIEPRLLQACRARRPGAIAHPSTGVTQQFSAAKGGQSSRHTSSQKWSTGFWAANIPSKDSPTGALGL